MNSSIHIMMQFNLKKTRICPDMYSDSLTIKHESSMIIIVKMTELRCGLCNLLC